MEYYHQDHGFKVFLIFKDFILRYISFDTFVEFCRCWALGLPSGLGGPLYPAGDMVPWPKIELLSLQVMNSFLVILQKFSASRMENASPESVCASITRWWMYFNSISRFIVELVIKQSRVVLSHGTSR